MKKYDLSKIMKRAWEYVRRFKMTISSGLKRAWMEAKNGLKGSPKQIAWANDIRNRAIDVLKLNIARVEKHKDVFPIDIEVYKSVLVEVEEYFTTVNEAKEIIDKRDRLSPDNILNYAGNIIAWKRRCRHE